MHPVLLQIGRFKVHSYGTMLALAFVVGILLTYARLKRTREIEPDKVVDLALFVLIGGIIGARLLYVLLNLRDYHSVADVVMVNRGGLSFHGGLLGAMLGGWVFARINHVPFLQICDLSSPAGALGYAITKVGCFLNGCCYGTPTDLPWACQFPAFPGALLEKTPPSHPVQIYDALINLPVFFILLALLRRKRYHGQVFFSWIVLYSLTRIFTEYFRQGVTAKYFLPQLWGRWITEAQFASALLVLLFGVVLAINRRRRDLLPEQAERAHGLPSPKEGNDEAGAER